MRKADVVVIGGGVAGTAAAYTLRQRGYHVTIIEKDGRLGGRVRSEFVDGTAIEMGAAFISSFYTNVHAFLQTTGLDQKLYRLPSRSGIVRGGEVWLAPRALANNRALSWRAKVQALLFLGRVARHWRQLDVHTLWRADKYDNRSVADVLQSRSEREFMEYILQPALNGYLYWTPEQTSEAVMLCIGKALLQHNPRNLHGGLRQVPETAAEGSKVLLNHAVRRVQRNKDNSFSVTVMHDGKQRTLRADGAVCATTATAVPELFPDLTTKQRQFFTAVRYSSTALIAQIPARTDAG